MKINYIILVKINHVIKSIFKRWSLTIEGTTS